MTEAGDRRLGAFLVGSVKRMAERSRHAMTEAERRCWTQRRRTPMPRRALPGERSAARSAVGSAPEAVAP
jgi:hypothetical protein